MSIKTYVSTKMSFLANSIRRFAFPFAYTVMIAIVSSYEIIKGTDAEQAMRLILSLTFGFFASILLTLLVERFTMKINVYLFQSLSVIATIGCWFLVKNYTTDIYVMMGYLGVTFAVAACIIYFLYDEYNRDLLAPHLLKGAIFSVVVAGILQVGLTICITAFDAIILNIPEMWKYVAILGVFTGIIVAVNLFLSGVPKAGEPITLPKVVKILIGTIGLPIYLLLIAILYIYLAKILITWNLPSNQINLYASLAALFFILFYFTLGSYRAENKLIDLFMKWGKFALIPIILVQLYAINLRVAAYGITTLRYISIILVSIVLVFLVLAIFKKGKYLKGIFVVIAAVAIIFTYTPLNVIDVPDRVQYDRLVTILEQNDMYQNGKVVANPNVSLANKGEITNIFEYLINSGGTKIPFIKAFRDKVGYKGYDSVEFSKTFGFLPYYVGQVDPSQPQEVYYNNTFLYPNLDVSGYSKMISDVGSSNGGKGGPLTVTKDKPTIEVLNQKSDKFTIDAFAVLEKVSKATQSGGGAPMVMMVKTPVAKGDYFISSIQFRKLGQKYTLEFVNGFVLEK